MSEQMDGWARRYADFFTQLKEPDLQRLDEFFAPDARFKDPFNDVTGLEQIAAVFRHMFRQCPAPRFYVHCWATQGNTAFFHWRFMDRDEGADGRMSLDVDGISRVLFNDEGKVFSHIDYWDTAEYLYDQIPLLGGMLRFVRRRIGT
ncbi:nuclear transport factor 2 family protein [Ectothiorhodospira lacustris]|uniref:nuclear transport factor 2 family protein n=1 Tax=Ectothiorhodospira lacustris TaxID=2899127 RepID=UPI001EE7A72B|nr:nuclear transport factor 2 family protein [Ectothiorhodospira lacustris]MCG5500009.1 nuclear transport factor 2 family protein [Ectothiorhodospira lacustris]MCG5510053.1 nuclear transport factor 2 family protein [Ectothiorhodospira lacustris]MCG5521799.1 nuclear transport factor 2 family protein [Ectothiorhodospira lacustris]